MSAKSLRALHAATNLLIVLLFALLAISSYLHFVSSGTLKSFGILGVNFLFLALFLTRSPAKAETPSLRLWALSMAGTALPLLLRPSDAGGLIELGTATQVAGLALLATALLSLRRSFAVVPANRGIRDGGLYRIVRHPVYSSELLVILGVVLTNPTAANLVIALCECALQFARACAEERFLAADPVYQAYRTRVAYRLIPGVV
jgi:protein-S-isoprenylcysteine O-methyltransferase Ste14